MRKLRESRRAVDQPVYTLIFEIFSFAIILLAFALYVQNLAGDTTYWKTYFSKDLAGLASIMNAAPGDIVFNYPYMNTMPINTPLILDITRERINVADKDSPDRPTWAAYLKRASVDVQSATETQPPFFQIHKTDGKLEFLFNDAKSTPPCPSPPTSLIASSMTFGFASSPAGSLDDLASTDASSLSSIASKLRTSTTFSGITLDRLSAPTPDIAFLLAKDDQATSMQLVYSGKDAPGGDAIACRIGNKLLYAFPDGDVTFSSRMANPQDLIDPALSTFLGNTGLRFYIIIPSSYLTPENTPKISQAISDALSDRYRNAIATTPSGGNP